MINKIFFVAVSSLFLSACASTATPTVTPQQPTATPEMKPVTPGQAHGKAYILIQGQTFSPDTITVKAGETVTVANNDPIQHTVTSDDGKSFNLGPIDPGMTVSMTAPSVAGTYKFHCSIHPTMTGTLIVQ